MLGRTPARGGMRRAADGGGERGAIDAPSVARHIGLRIALPIAGWTVSIGSVLLFGLSPIAAIALLLLTTSPALFAPADRPQ